MCVAEMARQARRSSPTRCAPTTARSPRSSRARKSASINDYSASAVNSFLFFIFYASSKTEVSLGGET
jgi:hypothetical protein